MDFLSFVGLAALVAGALWLMVKGYALFAGFVAEQKDLKLQLTLLRLEKDNLQSRFDALSHLSDEVIARNRELLRGLKEIAASGLRLVEDDGPEPEESWGFREWSLHLDVLDRAVKVKAEEALASARKIGIDRGAAARLMEEVGAAATGAADPADV